MVLMLFFFLPIKIGSYASNMTGMTGLRWGSVYDGFLCTKEQKLNFPPNTFISLECASQIPHFPHHCYVYHQNPYHVFKY